VGNVIPLPASGAEALPRVRPGNYPAVYVGHLGVTVFRTAKLRVDFRLLAHPDIVLARWYRVSDYRGARVRAGRHSSIVREVSAVLGRRVRADRIPVASLTGIAVILRVRDVVADADQNPLAPVNQYSVIERLLEGVQP